MSEFYETDRAVSEYLFFHYGDPTKLLPWDFGPRNGLNYPVRCVTELAGSGLPTNARGLDLGCAVGRSTFELARHCHEVIGIDFSQRFIDEAARLQRDGRSEYSYAVEGEMFANGVAQIEADIDRSRASFEQGDAVALRDDLGEFDIVLMANLLCRLPDPEMCLRHMSALIRPGGQLLITTPCTWLEEYTPRDKWLGGFKRNGQPIRTLDSLKRILGPAFELETTQDLPFLIREHERKFQWTVAQGTRWRRAD
ncbi:MAG: putative 4-mercaptohistidine N1-methyltransferase [Limisphaerales bacterium]